MAKLYTRWNDYIVFSDRCVKQAADNVEKLTVNCDGISEALENLKWWTEMVHDDAWKDMRGNIFATEDFYEDSDFKRLNEKVADAVRALKKARVVLEDLKKDAEYVISNTEFEYSEDLVKWYDEQHMYDYERA